MFLVAPSTITVESLASKLPCVLPVTLPVTLPVKGPVNASACTDDQAKLCCT